MKRLEVFYDYTCPYCYRGIKELENVLPDYPDVYVDWTPCEAHPRPESAAVHSDLAEQVAYFLKEKQLDVMKYNNLIYSAHFEKHERIDSPELLSELAAQCGADKAEVLKILSENKYADTVLAANKLVWSTLGFAAVPSYRQGELAAGSGGGLLVDIKKVEELMRR